MKKFEQIARDEAKKSKCNERQVGAILVRIFDGIIVGQGHNYGPTCDCNNNVLLATCPHDVVHAEIACLEDATEAAGFKNNHYTMFITQPPCNKCIQAIQEFCEAEECSIDIKICEQFLKFDDDKIRFDLIPPEWPEALAKVLTYGAKKYKPNNWRQGEIDRYIGAVYRHLNAWQKGELNDIESGMPHLWHVMTNVGFLLTLEEKRYED